MFLERQFLFRPEMEKDPGAKLRVISSLSVKETLLLKRTLKRDNRWFRRNRGKFPLQLDTGKLSQEETADRIAEFAKHL